MGFDTVQDPLHQPRPDLFFVDKGVDAKTSRFHQRELGGDKKRIRGKQEDRQQQIDNGGTHLPAMMSASMGGGLVRKR
jgi:hypothetical protein